MSWWKFWDRKPKHPARLKSPPEPKSENDHSNSLGNCCDSLTEYESRYITYSMFHQNVPNCPDCRRGFFLYGPEGGCSVNVICNGCGAEFNIVPPGFLDYVVGERIRERNSPDPTKLKYWKKEPTTARWL